MPKAETAERVAWEQQDDESSRAFNAFATFRNLPSAQRSIDTAWRQTVSLQLAPDDPRQQQLNDHRHPRSWGGWSAAHDWVARAAAWDGELDRQACVHLLAEHQAMLDRHLALATDMLTKGALGLEHLLVVDMDARDVATLIRIGVDIERRSRLLPELVTVTHSGKVEASVSVDAGPGYDALVDLLLHAPIEAILRADQLSGRVASDAGLLGRKSNLASRGAKQLSAGGAQLTMPAAPTSR